MFLSDCTGGFGGNFTVYPRSHRVLASLLASGDETWVRDPDLDQNYRAQADIPDGISVSPKTRPDLTVFGPRFGCDGRAYQVLARPGDVVLAHPLLAHAVGQNVASPSEDVGRAGGLR